MTDALPTPAYVFDEKALRARIGFSANTCLRQNYATR